jgi:hypothetical protein
VKSTVAVFADPRRILHTTWKRHRRVSVPVCLLMYASNNTPAKPVLKPPRKIDTNIFFFYILYIIRHAHFLQQYYILFSFLFRCVNEILTAFDERTRFNHRSVGDIEHNKRFTTSSLYYVYNNLQKNVPTVCRIRLKKIHTNCKVVEGRVDEGVPLSDPRKFTKIQTFRFLHGYLKLFCIMRLSGSVIRKMR